MKLTFPRNLGYERDQANDFGDDGSYFRMYKYRDVLPISALHQDGYVYVSIRDPKDRNGNYIEIWKDRDEFDPFKYNGVPEQDWDLKKFTIICEGICSKYNLIANPTSSTPYSNEYDALKNSRYKIKDFENIRKMVDYYNNGSSIGRIINALKNPVSREKFIDRYYLSRYMKWGYIEEWVDIARDVHKLTVDDLFEIDQLAAADRLRDSYGILEHLQR